MYLIKKKDAQSFCHSQHVTTGQNVIIFEVDEVTELLSCVSLMILTDGRAEQLTNGKTVVVSNGA